ncbi:MAG: hypothetical protein M3441_00970 [Chloroflexota bacterium]|nr:hypothetical protein [Chloroflexota bacterium]
MASGSIERNIVRILFILYEFGVKPIQTDMFGVDEYTRRVESELKMQKADFWLRYPDYFASALLRECEPGKRLEAKAAEIKDIIREIFGNDEPDVRWSPMLRFQHGAYERLDDVMCFLNSRRLATRRPRGRGGATEYLLLRAGVQAVEELVKRCDESHWYAERCRLINKYLGDLVGDEQRGLQYEEESYRNTLWNQVIPRIDADVKARFEKQFGEPL